MSEEESQPPTHSGRVWPELPPGFKLPNDAKDLKCFNYVELWSQCAAPSWWLKTFYRHGYAGFNCADRWENVKVCVLSKFKTSQQAQHDLEELLRRREQEAGPHVWNFRKQPPGYFKKFDYLKEQR